MGFDFIVIAPLLPFHCSFSCVFGGGVTFLVSSRVFLPMIVQRLVVLLALLEEGVRAHPSTPPSWTNFNFANIVQTSILTTPGHLEETFPLELINNENFIPWYPNMRLLHIWYMLIYVAFCLWKGSRTAGPEWLFHVFWEHKSTQFNLLTNLHINNSYHLLSAYYVPSNVQVLYKKYISANCRTVPKDGIYNFEFTDEETQAQKS